MCGPPMQQASRRFGCLRPAPATLVGTARSSTQILAALRADFEVHGLFVYEFGLLVEKSLALATNPAFRHSLSRAWRRPI